MVIWMAQEMCCMDRRTDGNSHCHVPSNLSGGGGGVEKRKQTSKQPVNSLGSGN